MSERNFLKFGVQNFKIFSKYTELEMRPITILVGPNNSGKSTLIEAMDLFQRNRNQNRLQFFNINNATGKNITLKSVVPKKTKISNLSFTITISLENKSTLLSMHPELYYFFWLSKELIITYSYDLSNTCAHLIEFELKDENNELLFYYKEENTLITCYIDLEYILKSIRNIITKINEPNKSFIISILSQKFPEDYYIFSNSILCDKLEENFSKDERNIIEHIFLQLFSFISLNPSEIEDEFGAYYEVSTVIEKLEIIYRRLSTKIPVSKNFLNHLINNKNFSIPQNVFEYLLTHNLDSCINNAFITFMTCDLIKNLNKVMFEALPAAFGNEHLDVIKFSTKGHISRKDKEHEIVKRLKNKTDIRDKTDRDFLNKWIGQNGFQIAEDLIIKYYSDLDLFSIKLKSCTGIVDINENGFGVNQLLSIILSIFTYLNRNLGPYYGTPIIDVYLLIEEPESNLHPKFQSRLADFFIDVKSEYHLKFIIETHSEYLIRKFQYLVANGKLNPDDIIIYYFNDPLHLGKNENHIKRIEILKDGSLSDDFGTGFYDEATTWQWELLRLKGLRKN
jgi:predicted ATPase